MNTGIICKEILSTTTPHKRRVECQRKQRCTFKICCAANCFPSRLFLQGPWKDNYVNNSANTLRNKTKNKMKTLDFFSLQSTCILWCEQFGSWNWQSQSIGASKKKIPKGEVDGSKKRRRRGEERKNFSPDPSPLPAPPPLVCQLLSWWKPLGCTFVKKKRLRLFCTDFLFVSVWYVKFLVHAFLSEKPYMTLLHPKNWQRGYDCQDFDFDCKAPWT